MDQSSLPPAAGECLTILESALAGAAPTQTPTKVLRSAEGKFRVDSGKTSVIFDPAKRQTVLLDHLRKEARVIPFDPPAAPGLPGVPQIPAVPEPKLPSVPPDIQELGKALIDGHEVEGRRFTFQPPPVPQPPAVPGVPQIPQPPQPPTISEVWTSTKLKLPVMTKTTGPFGQQTCKCKYAEVADPAGTHFEVPSDYTQVVDKVPR